MTKDGRKRGKKSKSNIIDFPLNIQQATPITPLELLAIMLKCVLKDRITDQEVDTICSLYYATVQEWWRDD